MRLGLLTSILIGIALVGFFSVIITVMVTQGMQGYNVTGNTTDLKSYNKMSEIYNITNASNSELPVKQNPNDPSSDISGGYLRSGVNAYLEAARGISLFQDMSRDATSSIPMESNIGSALMMLINTVILIIVVVAFAGGLLTRYLG